MAINFKHLHYFWVTAKAGGIVRAGEQLHTTPQTLSGQIKLLEERLGRRLFRKRGRQLELTDDGHVVMGYAEEIFNLGAELQTALTQTSAEAKVLEFRVGVADSVAKTVAYRLLEPALLANRPVRLVAVEGKFSELVGQLALHRLDMVLADEPLSRRLSIKAFNHTLGTSPVSFFCAPTLRDKLMGPFPQCLHEAPYLIQGATSSMRALLEAWFKAQQVQPRIVAEFDDGALMKAFGRQGHGIFAAPSVLEDETRETYRVEVVGRSPELLEQFYAVSVERRITHPCLASITQAARGQLFID
jgi:LysR family transcriptional regulator, transcriptional activator of nhaA